MDQQIWQWTLTKEAVAPCLVRDVLSMRQHANGDVDFFWLGHTPCRTVLLVGMVVGIQIYDKRSIYTIDDGTAVIDCVLRHPRSETKPRSPPRKPAASDGKPIPQRPSPKKRHLDKVTLESKEPPPRITEPGYPVRVVGRVVRYYESKQIHADTISPCPSSLDEIAHIEHVIELYKTKYSISVPFIPPPKPLRASPPNNSGLRTSVDADASVFSDMPQSGPRTTSYSIPPPPMPMPAQSRSRPPSIPIHVNPVPHDYTRAPSSPTASSIASSTPSSPCKQSSPAKTHEVPCKPKIRHPSRLHTGDLTGNTLRLYVKHYMDNAPPSSPISTSSPSQHAREGLTTPRKRVRDEDYDEPTPRPRRNAGNEGDENGSGMPLGFTLSHLRRVPELALLAARVVRAEARRRDRAERAKDRGPSRSCIPSSSSASSRSNARRDDKAAADSPRKKIKRLFAWAVVKLYEEGSIVLWDGDVRPLPVPPPPVLGGGGSRDEGGLWKGDNTRSTFGDPSVSCSRSYAPSTPGDPFLTTSTLSSTSASVLYTSSASALLYSDYHPPRRPGKHRSESASGKAGREADMEVVDEDADPGNVSDPGVDEEAYVPLTPQLLAGSVREAMGALRCGQAGGVGRVTGAVGRRTEPTPQDILAYLKRTDERWVRVGIWVVEEALAVLKAR